MADNFTKTDAQTAAFAADDIGSKLFPRVKLAIGADGVNDGDVSSSNPLPVTATAGSAEATIGSTAVVRTAVFNSADTQITNFGGPATSGGLSVASKLDVDESEDEIKASAGQVYYLHAANLSTGVRYLKLYNATAANTTVGSTTPLATFVLPTNGDTNGCLVQFVFPHGIAFSTALSIAATTGSADNDSGAPGTGDVIVTVGYK